MFSRISRVLDEYKSKSEFQNDLEIVPPIISEKQEPLDEPTIVTVAENEEMPKTSDFEPVEKQRHFGILHYTMTKRFRRMMIIGLVNVILIVSFFLFVFLFVELHKEKKPTTPVPKTTTRKPTTVDTGYCHGSSQKVGSKCWTIDSALVDHIKSERACTSAGAWLATAKNEHEHELMKSHAESHKVQNMWMGMYCTGDNITHCVWDDTIPVTFNNFASGNPDVSKGACVMLSATDWKWHSTKCSNQFSKMCELPRSHGDNYGCNSILGDWCYILAPPAPFHLAHHHCEAKCAQFASIHSVEENQWIRTLFSLRNDPIYTIGGYATSKNSIIWVDGTPMDFNNIQTFNGEGCLYMAYSAGANRGNWFTDKCTKNETFVCKRHLGISCPTSTKAPITVAPPPKSTCNKVFVMESGTFTSPNHPHAYPSNIQCTYTLITYGPQRISMVIDTNSIGSDQVHIYDGDSDSGNYKGMVTGTQTFSSYFEGNVAFVVFKAGDNKAGHTGFSGHFMTIY